MHFAQTFSCVKGTPYITYKKEFYYIFSIFLRIFTSNINKSKAQITK